MKIINKLNENRQQERTFFFCDKIENDFISAVGE